MDRLTEAQQAVCAELLSIDTGINCYEDASTIIDTIHNLVTERGETGLTIIRWLALLPRARDRAAQITNPKPVQLTLLTPLAGRTGAHMPAPHTLRDPDAPKKKPGTRAERNARRRPTHGTCVECGVEFEMNPTGRPSNRCPQHRQRKKTA